MNAEPVATITFKYKTAQRKFEERMIWDRLKQHSPVYDGDTIRTAPGSEATIYFQDGNIMDLEENTMAQIFFHDGQAEISVSDGEVVVNSEGSKNGAIITTDTSRVLVRAGSSITTSFSGDKGTQVSVLTGDAFFSDKNGITRTLNQGSAIKLNNNHEEQIVPLITVTSPPPNKKFLNFGGGDFTVKFKWATENLEKDDYLVLEIASDRKFKHIYHSENLKNTEDTAVSLPAGIAYWRIYPHKSGVNYSAVSKLNVYEMPPPELVVPEDGASFSYKTESPDIRFTWNRDDWVTAFDFEIADNPQMISPKVRQRITTPSSIVSILESGTWYWRVTPFYTINGLGLASPSKVRSFTVTKKDALAAPELILPAANDEINTATRDLIAFSWKNNPEAAGYEIKIGKDSECYDAKIVKRLDTNFLTIKPSDYEMQKGTWYWCVTLYDSAGDVSEKSQVRKFTTDQIQFEQKVLYPPEGFTANDNSIGELRFTWKTNIPGDNKFQIARDKEFKDLVIDETNNQNYCEGHDLDAGTYYWRISSSESPDRFSTKAQTIKVLAPLPMPLLISPREDELLTIQNNTESRFTWQPVEGADYYQFKFFASGKESEPLYSERRTSASCSLNLTEFDDGDYGWAVTAGTEQTDTTVRRRSAEAGRDLRIQQKRVVRLDYPLGGAAIDGIDALTKPERVKWSSEQEISSSIFTISRNADGKTRPVFRQENPGFEIKLPRLAPGVYYWTIEAKNKKGVDISAVKPLRITVKEIPPLQKPRLTLPADNKIYGAAQIRASRKITFAWKPVKNASGYTFSLRNERGQILINKHLTQTGYELSDMADLQNGRFTWSVQADQYLSDGTFVRRGSVATSAFTINLPAAGDIIINDTGVLYGM